MAELVDALVSGTSGAIHRGSSPLFGSVNTMTTNLVSSFQRVYSQIVKQSSRIFCNELSFIVDSELIRLLQTLSDRDFLESKFCIVATGGYGRRELSPYSDVDLLFIYDSLGESDLEKIVKHFTYYLYDSKKDVGYACRTVDECKTYLDELESFFTILDSRYVLGSESLFLKYKREVLEKLPQEFLIEHKRQKLSDLEQSLNSPLHISEPNVKLGPFGLRDIQTIYWLEKAEKNITSLSSLAILPIYQKGEIQELELAYDFYLKVRNALHIYSNKKVDVLSIPLQPQVAKILKFDSVNELYAVDTLMRKYYSHESLVFHVVELYLDYQNTKDKKSKKPYHIEDIKLEKLDNKLYPHPFKPIFTNPARQILQIFAHSQEFDLEISPLLQSEIRFATNFLEENYFNSKVAIDLFLLILKQKKHIGKILTLMHRTEVLGKIVPEFGECRDFPLFSYHHHYSVDEHTLLILRELDKLIDGKFELSDIQEIFDQCKNIYILALAILLHDAGKVKPVDHCQYGAEFASALGERLGLQDEEIQLLRFLVAEHILMSEISTKRDINDPDTLKEFAVTVENEDKLNLLYVFTIIDIKSTGKSTLTNWKRAILSSLYESTLQILQRGVPIATPRTQLQRELVDKEGLKPELANFVAQRMKTFRPSSYWNYFTTRRIFHHFQIFYEQKDKLSFTPVIEIEVEPAYTTLSIFFKDNFQFLAEIAGVISSVGLNIIGLRNFSDSQNFAIVIVQITNSKGSGDISQERLEKLKENLVLVYEKKSALENLLNNPSEWFFSSPIPEGMVEEKIEFDNQSSDEYTILEVRLPDSIGLLYRILKELLKFPIKVEFIKVSTSADYAYDSFYLKTKEDTKISNPNLLNSIIQNLRYATKKGEQVQTYALTF